jgi:hypothetical protein
MPELGGTAGLAQEPVHVLLAHQVARARDLDGDDPVLIASGLQGGSIIRISMG